MAHRSYRPWAIWRRIQYGLSFASIWLLVGALVYFVNFYQPANCFDGIMNGEERGVDCGGGCVRICPAEVLPPQVVWAKSFEVTEGQYNTVAYVENPNQTAATPALEYTFSLLREGAVVAERSGTTVLPPNSVYPIFEGRVFTESRQAVDETRITLQPAQEWLPASVGRDQFRSLDIALSDADSRPVLDVEIENTALVAAEDVEVVATILNDLGEPVTASQTFIERIEPRSTQDIVFTWPNPIARTVRSCIIPTDVALGIDLSGSMNNDGEDPPQPITDALGAASRFVDNLQETDQVAVVTFATRANLTTQLTNLHTGVTQEILDLTIDPVEERGFTNTIAAFERAQEELNSERHNDDARRVLVLLTDGLPTAEGDEDVVARTQAVATALDEDGIELYAIGLGENVDQSFIQSIASDSSNAFLAPTGADLDRIYAEITSSLCESGPTKIDVIAKTETNFAELR